MTFVHLNITRTAEYLEDFHVFLCVSRELRWTLRGSTVELYVKTPTMTSASSGVICEFRLNS